MRFSELFQKRLTQGRKTLSFEFFPPRQHSGLPETYRLVTNLAECAPDFMTVTYGANGGARAHSLELTQFIQRTLTIPAVQHLTCVGHTRQEINQIVERLQESEVGHILALRGDRPKETLNLQGDFNDARSLVSHLSSLGGMSLGVAGYPETHREALSPEADLAYLKQKIDAGGEVVFTQLFFAPELYFDFVDRAREIGITVPIVPGIMPISNVTQLERFTQMCGATVPEKVRTTLHSVSSSPEEVTRFGTSYATQLCEALLEGGAPGIHFYTINRSAQVERIVNNLGCFS